MKMESVVSYTEWGTDGVILVADRNGLTRLFYVSADKYWNITYHPVHGIQVDAETGKVFMCEGNFNAR